MANTRLRPAIQVKKGDSFKYEGQYFLVTRKQKSKKGGRVRFETRTGLAFSFNKDRMLEVVIDEQ